MALITTVEWLRRNSRALRHTFFVLLGALVLVDILLSREHAHYFLDRIRAYWAIFAVIGCFVLIKFSKGAAHLLLSKSEDYYG